MAAFVLAALLPWWLEPAARRLDLMDYPKGRKDHERPTPVTGGLAMAIASVLAYWAAPNLTPSIQAFCIAAVLLGVVVTGETPASMAAAVAPIVRAAAAT